MRLSPWRRYTFYIVTTVLVATGLLWMVADQLKGSNEGETWQALSATALMIHGGAAMIVLVQVGGLFEIHMLRGWRRGHNRLTGLVMAALTCSLVVSAFGLYYSGVDIARAWISGAHITAGIAMPLMLLLHIWRGRKSHS